MREANPTQFPWWKEPMLWLIIGLPLSAVIGGLITWRIAAEGADPLVAEDYYKQGLIIHQTMEREARAAALNLSLRLTLEGRQVQAQLRGRLDSYPDRLLLALVHPTRAEHDMQVVLTATDQGEYRAVLPKLPVGPHRVIVQPENQQWRLNARAEWPLRAALILGDRTTTSEEHITSFPTP